MTRSPTTARPAQGAAQGEAVITWGLWALLLVVLAVTYTRLDPAELYHTSRDGFAGGMSRVLVAANFPLALAAIALALIALDALPSRSWRVGGPAIALCALTAWPGVVDDGDLDARLINVLPALGVALVLGLTLAAASRTGRGVAPRQSLDRTRALIAGVALVLSIPWIAADLGFFLPDGIFITERPITGADGNATAAVHLGHHHGLDGTFLVLSALLLSRPRLRSRTTAAATTMYVSLMFAYGAVNLVEDFWHEQIQKRDLVAWEFPSALKPDLSPIWLLVLALAAATTAVIRAHSPRPND